MRRRDQAAAQRRFAAGRKRAVRGAAANLPGAASGPGMADRSADGIAIAACSGRRLAGELLCSLR